MNVSLRIQAGSEINVYLILHARGRGYQLIDKGCHSCIRRHGNRDDASGGQKSMDGLGRTASTNANSTLH